MGAALSNKPTPATRTANVLLMGISSLLLLGGLLLGRASAAESVRHTVVSFLAGVLEKRAVDLSHGDFSGPRLGPRARIVDCELIQHRVGVQAGEALCHLQLLRCRSVLN